MTRARALLLMSLSAFALGACEWLFNPDNLAPDGGSALDGGGTADGGDAGTGSDGGTSTDGGVTDSGSSCVPLITSTSSCTPLCIDAGTFGPLPTFFTGVVARGPAPDFLAANEGSIVVWTSTEAWLILANTTATVVATAFPPSGDTIKSVLLSEGHEIQGRPCPLALVTADTSTVVQVLSAPNCFTTTSLSGLPSPLAGISWTAYDGGAGYILASSGAGVAFLLEGPSGTLPSGGSSPLNIAPRDVAPTRYDGGPGWLISTVSGGPNAFCSAPAGPCVATGVAPPSPPLLAALTQDDLLAFETAGTTQVDVVHYFDAVSSGSALAAGAPAFMTATAMSSSNALAVLIENGGVVAIVDAGISAGGVAADAGPSQCAPPSPQYAAALPPNLLVVMTSSGGLSIVPAF